MATKEHDTDPSTPSARRPTEGLADDPVVIPREQPVPVRTGAPMKPSTDPGVGPAPQLRAPSERPMGIVVPAAALSKKDSVELLLEGMTTPQPPRTKTMPQTGGEASAAYHARHDVRAARTSPDDEPKVIVRRQHSAPAVRAEQTTAPDPDEVRGRAVPGPTAELPPRLAPRIAVALGAGGLVVLVLFGALAVFRASRAAGEAPAAAAAIEMGPVVIATAAPTAAATATANADRPPTPPATPTPAVAEPIAVPVLSRGRAATKSATSAKASAQPPLPASTGPDLSELKTSFHD